MNPADDHEERIDAILRNAYQGEVAHGREPVFHRTPLHEVVGREEGEEENDFAAKGEALSVVLEYIFQDGPHPGHVVRRVYALARIRRSDLLLNMSLEEIGMMLGETRAAQSWRIDKIFSGYLKKAGMKGFRLPWQKPDEARAKYKKGAQGNTNRRGGGKKKKKS